MASLSSIRCGRLSTVTAAIAIKRLTHRKSSRLFTNAFECTLISYSPAYYSHALHTVRAASGLGQKSDTNSPANQGSKKPLDTWKIKMLYDGECPLCMREVNMLQERNKLYGTIKFVDISSDGYSPEENAGLDYKTAFRGLYEEVGLGWVYAITKYEPIATILNAVYSIWAKYRLEITGRPPLQQVLEERQRKKDEACSDEGRCRMN
ncbi:uncharacterized protein At5g50100, chloroplastic isoform X2 [Cryptomeria japonica]|uniref:uncharacterized protein At5g50100, chloroplastic isoform X2 n=1 Tax=Cryptomeria japonica TaxID=3369 RepID=UPI0027DAABC9|nr:uncharacterized protein At5g50100, chloroplastic isoform X2 [Cryptomeria japonica]